MLSLKSTQLHATPHQPKNTLDSNFQFNITFSHRALQLDTGDLLLNGGIAAKSKINSVKYVGGTSYLVDVKTTDTSSGTLGLDLKGVDGSGTNNIIQANLQLDQQSLAKLQITDSKVFGQSFIPATSGQLIDIVVRTGVGHSYNGNGTMELITGEGYGGTVIASQAISVDQSHSEKTYTFSNPATVSAGSKYTVRFNFPNAPNLSTAFSAQVGPIILVVICISLPFSLRLICTLKHTSTQDLIFHSLLRFPQLMKPINLLRVN